MKDAYIIGSSIGRRHEHTAFAVARQVATADGARYEVGHLQRLPRDTSYVSVAERMAELAEKLREKGAEETANGRRLAGPSRRRVSQVPPAVHAIADLTGAGRPVFDLLREEVEDLSGLVISASSEPAGRMRRVSKRDLAATIDVLLQRRRLQFAKRLPEGDVLRKELQNFEARVNAGSEASAFEEWREGSRDDLVFALAAACWLGEDEMPEDWSDVRMVY